MFLEGGENLGQIHPWFIITHHLSMRKTFSLLLCPLRNSEVTQG